MALLGADVLLYPTAIGSEIGDQADNDTADMWRRAMDGHAVCNAVHLAAANRVGTEDELTFYGSSFIVDHRGRPLAEADRTSTTTIMAELDLDAARADRARMGPVPRSPSRPVRRPSDQRRADPTCVHLVTDSFELYKDRRGLFTTDVSAYDEGRPGYPDRVFEVLA